MWKLGDDWERIVCIGDLHGDLDALIRILLETSIINGDGNWSDDQSLLVLLGDLNDRGPDSANIISYIMELQRQATASGGCVESLLGNHEMMAAQGDFDYVRSSEVIALESFWFAHLNGLHAIYRGNSPYAKWLRQRPTMISAGRSLFVHAGVESRFMDLDPGEINAIMSSWVGYFQGIEPEPDGATYWLTAQNHENRAIR